MNRPGRSPRWAAVAAVVTLGALSALTAAGGSVRPADGPTEATATTIAPPTIGRSVIIVCEDASPELKAAVAASGEPYTVEPCPPQDSTPDDPTQPWQEPNPDPGEECPPCSIPIGQPVPPVPPPSTSVDRLAATGLPGWLWPWGALTVGLALLVGGALWLVSTWGERE